MTEIPDNQSVQEPVSEPGGEPGGPSADGPPASEQYPGPEVESEQPDLKPADSMLAQSSDSESETFNLSKQVRLALGELGVDASATSVQTWLTQRFSQHVASITLRVLSNTVSIQRRKLRDGGGSKPKVATQAPVQPAPVTPPVMTQSAPVDTETEQAPPGDDGKKTSFLTLLDEALRAVGVDAADHEIMKWLKDHYKWHNKYLKKFHGTLAMRRNTMQAERVKVLSEMTLSDLSQDELALLSDLSENIIQLGGATHCLACLDLVEKLLGKVSSRLRLRHYLCFLLNMEKESVA